MKWQDTLNAVCRIAVGPRNAKDSLEMANYLGFERDTTCAFLQQLWRKGLVRRITLVNRKDSYGRPRRTFGYFVREDEIVSILGQQENVREPRGKPRYSAALEFAWR